jgi:purine-nucleoside phosphorylase
MHGCARSGEIPGRNGKVDPNASYFAGRFCNFRNKSVRALTDRDEFTQAESAAQFIFARTAFRPRIALVLGSGLGGFADELENSVHIPYTEIPSFPQSTAVGHTGTLVIGSLNGLAVAVMQGRVHLYEGYSARQVAFPMRVFGRMGVRAVVLTNAAGGINPSYGRGALVAIRDHINLQGTNPLVGPNDERFGPRFPDMTDSYSPVFRKFVLDEARRLNEDVYEGIYAAMLGPSYETPAEIRYLRTIGADLVGMSTVLEVIAARHMGLEVLAISCVTNMAAGMSGKKISHDEVLETGQRVRGEFLALLRAVLPKIDQYLNSGSA